MGRRPVILGLVVLALVPGATGCSDRQEQAQKRARAAREKARRPPQPLRLATAGHTPRLAQRLHRLLSSQKPPFRVVQRTQPLATSLPQLGAGTLDVVLTSGPPTPAIRSALPALRDRVTVRLAGADTLGVLANTSNRSGRLDLDALVRILRGQVTRWKEVSGDDLPLIAYLLAGESDVTRLLGSELLKGAAPAPRVRRVADVATLLESARRTPGALVLVPPSRWPDHTRVPKGLKLLALARDSRDAGATALDGRAATQGRTLLRLPVLLLVRRGSDPAARHLAKALKRYPGARLGVALGLPEMPPKQRAELARAWR